MNNHDRSIQILENIDEAVITTDKSGSVTYMNPAAQSMTQKSDKQATGRHFTWLFSAQELFIHPIQAALEAGRPISRQEVLLLNRPMASPLPVQMSIAPIYCDIEGIDGVVITLISQARVYELEEAVRRSDRLSMLGTLASSLAHEIKNPLSGIKGAAQLLLRECGDNSNLSEYAALMIREADRVNRLIETLMDLSRHKPLQRTSVNLCKIINDISLLHGAGNSSDRKLILDIDPSIPEILSDPDRLSQLLLNLVKNAAEATGTDGKISIRTRIASECHKQIVNGRTHRVLSIEVADNGCGIAKENLDRIFTPLYTTKSKGSGLGLAVVQKILDELDGTMKIYSRVEQGTTFSLLIPFSIA